MVRVATRQAENPMGIISKKLSLGKSGGVQVLREQSSNVPSQEAWEAQLPGMLLICLCLANLSSLPLTLQDTSPCWAWATLWCQDCSSVLSWDTTLIRRHSKLNLPRREFHCQATGWEYPTFIVHYLATSWVFSQLQYPVRWVQLQSLSQPLHQLIKLAYFQVFKAAQPALLYLVPFTLLPLFAMAYLKGDLKSMWSEPFVTSPAPKYQTIWKVTK